MAEQEETRSWGERSSMLSVKQADTIIDYLETMEEAVRHDRIMSAMTEKGYSPEEVDEALKILGVIAGRDCGIL